jgi:hypothetical protein
MERKILERGNEICQTINDLRNHLKRIKGEKADNYEAVIRCKDGNDRIILKNEFICLNFISDYTKNIHNRIEELENELREL